MHDQPAVTMPILDPPAAQARRLVVLGPPQPIGTGGGAAGTPWQLLAPTSIMPAAGGASAAGTQTEGHVCSSAPWPIEAGFSRPHAPLSIERSVRPTTSPQPTGRAPNCCTAFWKIQLFYTLVTHQPLMYKFKTQRIWMWGGSPSSNPMSFEFVHVRLTD